MSWCCCSVKTFATTVTLVTGGAFPTFLYFTYRDIEVNTTTTKFIFHALSGAAGVVGSVFFFKMLYSLIKESLEDWRVSVIFVYVASFLVAFFEMNGVMIGVTLGSWLIMLLLTCMDLTPPRRHVSEPPDEESAPILHR